MRTKAAVLYEMGLPSPYAASRPVQVREVELEAPGPGEALVAVAAAGLCHSDLSVVNGTRPRPMPMVLGHEASGIVRQVGPGPCDFHPGDHVVFSYVPTCGRCLPCVGGRAALCEKGAAANAAGTLLSGARRFRDSAGRPLNHQLGVSAFSQLTVCAQESLVRIDPLFPLDKAALFGCAVLTGVGAAIHTAGVRPGESVVVVGLGGVGLCAVLGALLTGACPVVAVDILDAKLAVARELGATHAVNAGEPGAGEAICEITGGGAHHALEAAGSDKALSFAYAVTRRGGTTVTIGLPPPDRHFSVPIVSLVGEERVVKGSYMGSSVPRRDVPKYLALHQAGRLPVDRLLTRAIQLEEINEALDSLDRGEEIRQVILFDEEGA
ncbi:MAG: zinc-binding dehydrogenase [Armatimonadetes bacterium]|nr:zinc-binding dehydrogenase [Armatimonadota bacterium]